MSPWRWRPMAGALASAAFRLIVRVTAFSKTGLLSWAAGLFLLWKALGHLGLACAVSSWPSGTPLWRSTGRSFHPPPAGQGRCHRRGGRSPLFPCWHRHDRAKGRNSPG
jgi:hypothetical protein